MLTNACKYAIRAVMYLAIHSSSKNKLGAKEVAEALEIPQPFLAQLLRILTTDKLISSSKGPGGGFFLNKRNLELTIWDIITAIDGKYKLDDCFLGLAKCNNTNPCPIHHIVAPFKKEILDIFMNRNIAELAGEIEANGTVLSLKGFDISG